MELSGPASYLVQKCHCGENSNKLLQKQRSDADSPFALSISTVATEPA